MPSFIRGFLAGAILTVALFNFVDILKYWFVFWVLGMLILIPKSKVSKTRNKSVPRDIEFM